MTISITSSACTYSGDGTTTAFDVKDGSSGIYFETASELTVTLRSGDTITTQTLATHYTVSGAGSAAGVVTFLTAPSSGVEIRIERNTPLTQTLSLSQAGDFNPTAIMGAFDKTTRAMQDLRRIAGGSGPGTYNSTPMTLDPSGDEWDADNKIIGGVADGTDSDHAVNYGQLQDILVTAGAGDVVGLGASIDGEIALFDSTSGKLLKRATATGLLKAASGVLSAATAGSDYLAPSAITNMVVTADIANMLETTDIGTSVQAYDPDTLKADTADVLTAGFATTPYSAGTKSSGTFTPDEANGSFQYATNGGAHTLAPPTNNTSIVIQYTNNGSAGTITTSGFTKVSGTAPGTTNGDDFLAFVTKINGFSHLSWVALQ